MNASIGSVIVVGAGPAGATCARVLAEGGREVTLIDRARPPRYKTCGGGLVGRALRHLDLDVSPALETSCKRLELHLADSDRPATVERDDARVGMMMRADFDRYLVEAAVAAGAELDAPTTVEGLSRRTGGGWIVRTDREERRARWLIAADGASSPVARAAGWPRHRHLVPAIESEIRVPPAVHARFAGTARFDFGPVPAGYAWVFPKAGHLSVGCMSTDRRPNPPLRSSLDRYLEFLALEPIAERADRGWVIPVRPRARSLARDGVLLTGDAAGLADPIACEGISNAVLSGRLAAEAVARPGPGGVERTYERSLERHLLPELRSARWLAQALYRHPRLRRRALGRFRDELCEVMADVFAGTRSVRSLVSRPGSYLRLLGWRAGPDRPVRSSRPSQPSQPAPASQAAQSSRQR